jgi:hypothetical protein
MDYFAARIFGARVVELSAAWVGESPLPWLPATIEASAAGGTLLASNVILLQKGEGRVSLQELKHN